MSTNIENIVQHRRGTTQAWNISPIVPYEGELVIEECIDGTCRAKIGDGKHTFNQLSYLDAATEANIEALKPQVNKNSSDISSINVEVSNLKREVDGVSSAVQSIVDPSIEKLDAMYNTRLNAIEAQHTEDKKEIYDTLNTTKKELSDDFTDKLSEHAANVSTNIEAKAATVSSELTSQFKANNAELQKQIVDLSSKQSVTDTNLEVLNSKVNVTDASLTTSINRINAGELKIEELITEVTKLKEFGYVDFVTSEMIGQLRAVEAKVEQLTTSDINVVTHLYEAQASINKLIRQLKELQNQHNNDFETVNNNFNVLKKDLREADSENLEKITAELTKLWKEITDLVDDDVLLYERILAVRNNLNAKMDSLKAEVEAITATTRDELTSTISAKEDTLKDLINTKTENISKKLTDTKEELTSSINSVKSVYEANVKATDRSIQSVKTDIVNKYTELSDKITGVVGDVNQHKADVQTSFTAVDNKIIDINKKFRETDSKLAIEKDRIDSQAKQISQFIRLEDGSTTGDAELIDARINHDGKKTYDRVGDHVRSIGTELAGIRDSYKGIPHATASETIQAISDDIQMLESNFSQYTDSQAVNGLHYDANGEVGLKEPYILYLKNAEGEIIQESGVQIISGAPGTGGGGGSAATSSLSISRITPQVAIFKTSDPAILEFTFSGTDSSGEAIMQASAEWKFNGITKAYGTVNAGNNTFDITKYLNSSEARILLVVTDSNGSTVTKDWRVRQVDLSLTSSFDDKSAYIAGENIIFTYKPIGAIDKTLVLKLDGEEFDRVDLPASKSGSVQKYENPEKFTALSHGSHLLEAYLEAYINGVYEPSDSIFKDILIKDPDSKIPLIGTATQKINTQQYATSNIIFTVYDPKAESPTVEISVDDTLVLTKTINPNPDYNNSPTAIYPYAATEAGEHVIKITCGEAIKEIIISVESLDLDIKPVTAGLAFDFNPVYGNNDILWTQNGIAMTVSENFDWINGGYIPDEVDGPCFCIKAGSTATISHELFGDDNVKENGKSFKLIFKTKNVSKPDAVFLSCLDNTTDTDHVGIKMGVHNANIYSKSGNLELAYSEDDVIEFGFNISGAEDDVKMVMGYEDGIPSRPMIYNDLHSFKQISPKYITLGSTDCDLYIYRLKAYNVSLTAEEILNSFILDARTPKELISRYNRNQIYDANTDLDPDILAEKCPWLRVYKLSAPYFTNNKSDKVPGTTIQQIYKNGDPLLDNWICYNAQHSGQGTSSNNYGAAGRNLDFIMNKSGIADVKPYFELGDATIANKVRADKISLTRESVPVAYLNAKVNIASSNNLTNAVLAARYNEFNPYRRPFVREAKLEDNYSEVEIAGMTPEEQEAALAKLQEKVNSELSFIKDTMEFHNCVIFIQETDPDISTHREFADNDWHFYAIGNIGDSKKTDDTRLTDPSDKYECCVEIMDISLPLSDFPVNTMINATTYDSETGEIIHTWATPENKSILYELIDGEYIKLADDAEIDLATHTYYVDILENDDFSEDYTYGWRYISDDEDSDVINTCKQAWIDFYRFVTTTSDEEFKARLSEYFVVDSALYYYLFTTRYCMVDNRAKNTFWHYGKTADGTRKWDLCWDYDNDTSLGLNNYGKQVYRYGLEDTDYDEKGTEVFRESDSTFFCRIRDLFAQELKEMYRDLESKNAWHAESFIKYCDQWQEEFPEELWRLDIERKYIRTYNKSFIDGPGDSQFLENMSNGRMKYQRRQWERSQEKYMASKYQTSLAAGDTANAQFRAGSPADDSSGASSANAVSPKYQFTLTPFSYMYLNVRYGGTGTEPITVKVTEPGKPIVVPYSGNYNDLIYVYSASNISDFGDLSSMYLKTASIGNAPRVKKFILGNSTTDYKNPNLESLTTGSNPLLEELDITNVTGLKTALDLKSMTNLTKLYAFGSAIPGVLFAEGGKLAYAELPAVTDITLKNLKYLKSENFKVSDYSNVVDLIIERCPQFGSIDTLLSSCVSLQRVRLVDVNFGTYVYNDFLNKFNSLKGIDASGKETEHAWLAGTVHFSDSELSGAQYNEITSMYPELKVTYEKLVSTLAFKDANGKTLYTSQSISDDPKESNDNNGINPVMPGAEPQKAPDDSGEFEYTFVGWSVEPNIIIGENDSVNQEELNYNALNNIIGDRILYPVFQAVRSTYEVIYINPTAPEAERELCRAQVPYGETDYGYGSKYYTATEPIKKDTEADPSLFTFAGFRDINGNVVTAIQNNITLYAEFYVSDGTWYTLPLGEIEEKKLNDQDKTMSITNTIIKLPYNPAIKIPETYTVDGVSYTVIGVGGFQNASYLELISLPDTTTEITYTQFDSWGAFEKCTNLAEITFPEALQRIGEKAFYGCNSLSEIYIPANVISIGKGAFAACKKLKSIRIDPNNNRYAIINNCLMETATHTLIQALPQGSSEVTIDNNTQILTEYCFDSRQDITKVIIPSAIAKIPTRAFGSCSNLTTVELSNEGNLTTIGASSFTDCGFLSNINLPDGLKTIGTYAFKNSSLQEIEIPSSVTTIGDHAFGNILSLKVVTFKASEDGTINIPTIANEFGKGAFEDSGEQITFNLPWTKAEHIAKFGSELATWGANAAILKFSAETVTV